MYSTSYVQAFLLAATLLQITPASVITRRDAPMTTAEPSTTPDATIIMLTNSTTEQTDISLHTNPSNETITESQESTVPQGTASGPNYTDEELNEDCTEPDEEELRRQMAKGNHHLKNPEIALLKGDKVLDTKATLFPTPESYSRYHYSDFHNRTCPTELLGVTGDINTRSICPWTLIENVNPARYPPVIMYAECRCPDCIDPSSSESGFLHDHESTCRPVTFKMKVLHRRECMMGIYMYESVYEEIPVACSCVRNTIV